MTLRASPDVDSDCALSLLPTNNLLQALAQDDVDTSEASAELIAYRAFATQNPYLAEYLVRVGVDRGTNFGEFSLRQSMTSSEVIAFFLPLRGKSGVCRLRLPREIAYRMTEAMSAVVDVLSWMHRESGPLVVIESESDNALLPVLDKQLGIPVK